MTSTYSANLGIELIGTGDQSGTWGTTTNNNLGTLLEQSIVGYVSQAVTDGADTTILITNGSSSVGRNYVINLTGALTADRNVLVPAVNKTYVFVNSTTGGFSVTVKVTGQTGVTIANGKKALVYVNGTDVIEIANAPVTEAATQTLTNKTLTSPTLITPALGTPASGVVTNLTGTASININGTVGATTPTTGTFTTSTATTITSPAATNLTIQSAGTTAMTIDTSQNVGIATASPSFKLDVAGTGRFTGLTQFDNAITLNTATLNYLYYNSAISFSQNGTGERMRIDSSGNVGIGTTSPTGKLNISTTNNSVIQLISGTTNGIRLGVDPSAGYGVIEGVDKTGTASYQPLQLGGSDVRFLISSTERMRIDSSGNLLVGTTSLTDGSRVVIRPATNQSGLTVQQNGVGDYCIHLNAVNNSGSFYYQYFVAGATNVGSISSNTTTTSYNTSSDYRLKENVASMTIGLATIAALRPVTYDWKIDGSSGEGFIAHELQEVIPHAVTGTKDAVDANGKPVYQGVDYSKIVVHLVAALQELKAEFDAYKASHA